MLPQQYTEVLAKHLPAQAVLYCADLWHKQGFLLKITRPRQTKLGDYCFHPQRGHQITVNHNLNPYAFLITYLHEVAHLLTFKQHSNKKAPHGKEWKKHFQALLTPVMHEGIFPQNVLQALKQYAHNPLASTSRFAPLREALQTYDPAQINLVPLQTLSVGALFELRGRRFVRGELRRTRVLCTDTRNARKYTIAANTPVKKCS